MPIKKKKNESFAKWRYREFKSQVRFLEKELDKNLRNRGAINYGDKVEVDHCALRSILEYIEQADYGMRKLMECREILEGIHI